MTAHKQEDMVQNEEQELKELLVRVLKEPLKDMTSQLREKIEESLSKASTAARNGAMVNVETALGPMKENLEGLTESIENLQSELLKESQTVTAQMLSVISEHLKTTEQQISTSIRDNFKVILESAESKHEILLSETNASISRVSNQLEVANTRSASVIKKLLGVYCLSLVVFMIFLILFLNR